MMTMMTMNAGCNIMRQLCPILNAQQHWVCIDHASCVESESDDDDEIALPQCEGAAASHLVHKDHPRHIDLSESDETDEGAYARTNCCINKKVSKEKKPRPKAGDFNDIQQKIIAEVNSYYQVLLSTVNDYPLPAQELDFVKEAWQYALDEMGMKDIELKPSVSHVVSNLISGSF